MADDKDYITACVDLCLQLEKTLRASPQMVNAFSAFLGNRKGKIVVNIHGETMMQEMIRGNLVVTTCSNSCMVCYYNGLRTCFTFESDECSPTPPEQMTIAIQFYTGSLKLVHGFFTWEFFMHRSEHHRTTAVYRSAQEIAASAHR